MSWKRFLKRHSFTISNILYEQLRNALGYLFIFLSARIAMRNQIFRVYVREYETNKIVDKPILLPRYYIEQFFSLYPPLLLIESESGIGIAFISKEEIQEDTEELQQQYDSWFSPLPPPWVSHLSIGYTNSIWNLLYSGRISCSRYSERSPNEAYATPLLYLRCCSFQHYLCTENKHSSIKYPCHILYKSIMFPAYLQL
mgnify:CR=1 FL=1